MPLTGQGLSALVYADHLSLFPTAVDATRERADRGISKHNVPEAFIGALCNAYVSSLKTMTIKDLGAGVLGVPPGTAPPTQISFPGSQAAVAQLIGTLGLAGTAGPSVAQSFVGNVLTRSSQLGLLQMFPNSLMAIGTGVVSPASNPDLYAAMLASLNTTLPLEFQATGKFAANDVPGAPVNSTLAKNLPIIAAALATGTATMIATVTYAGGSGPTTPVAGAINFGKIL